jgi:16S rRNA (cytidine1402-2'-O)-methyltransferase
MSTLFIIATPIGNLSDFGFRSLETFKNVDLILCEDTRVTKKLLERYKIEKPVLSYHQHSKLQKINYILDLLKNGKNLALVSDAGTPGVSDPGNLLIKEVVEKLG